MAHLHFCQHTEPNKKMQKSHQTNAPRHTNWTDNTTTEKKGEPLTAATKNWRFSG